MLCVCARQWHYTNPVMSPPSRFVVADATIPGDSPSGCCRFHGILKVHLKLSGYKIVMVL